MLAIGRDPNELIYSAALVLPQVAELYRDR